MSNLIFTYFFQVHHFELKNNTIGAILTSAIIHDSNITNIEGNAINNLTFLSLDTDTKNFSFQGNTVMDLALESLVVNNALNIHVMNNSFYHVERFGLSWLRSKQDGGRMTFTGNHFYKYEKGSLIFYFSVYNEKLVIDGNILHITTCNCTSLRLIEEMAEVDDNMIHTFRHERELTSKMFIESSYCHDDEGKEIDISSSCHVADSHYHNWHITVIVTMVLCGILVIAVLKKCLCKARYNSLLKASSTSLYDVEYSQSVSTESEHDEV